MCARLGGDEFAAVFVDDEDIEDKKRRAEEMRRSFTENYKDLNIGLSMSFGISQKLIRSSRDIEDFIDAGINFWMITGDKMDKAETIGYSCGIISEDSEVYKIRENKDEKQILEQKKDMQKKL